MKKKLLSILLTLAMVLTMIPMATGVAFAGTQSYLKIDDVTVFEDGIVKNSSGTGWSYDKSTNTLTLTNMEATNISLTGVEQPLNITIVGNVLISNDNGKGIYANGADISITSEAKATLTINTRDFCIKCNNLTISENVELVLSSNYETAPLNAADIENSGSINAEYNGTQYTNPAISAGTICNCANATMIGKAKGTGTDGIAVGIVAEGTIVNKGTMIGEGAQGGIISISKNIENDAGLTIKAGSNENSTSEITLNELLESIDSTLYTSTYQYVEISEKAQSTPSIGYFVYDVEKYREILADAQRQQALIDAQQAGTKPAEPTTEPTAEKLTASEAKALVGTMVPTVRTENQARGIKVFVKDSEEVAKFKAAGYKVLYDFYRAESKAVPSASDYKITTVVNKEDPWYLNTAAKKGKKYYYKAVAKVYDANGELVAETELTQGKYGCRTR